MPDWQDVLADISGGAIGINKGFTLGAEPYKAWDAVRASGLANDKSALSLRDMQMLQDELEKQGDYYGNLATAKNTANKVATAKGNLDIFGNQTALDVNRGLADPMGMFQQAVQAAGLTPADPEFRQLYAQFVGYQDPTGAIKAYDTMGVPKLEQQNLNLQAVLSNIQNLARMEDPGATVQRKPDGTFIVLGSNGEEMPINPNFMMKIAAQMGSPTPIDAYYKGLQSEEGIQKTNLDMYKAIMTGAISPTIGAKMLDSRRVALDKDISAALGEITRIVKDAGQNALSQEELDAKLAEPKARLAYARAEKNLVLRIQDRVVATSRLPGTQPSGTPSGALPKVSPVGGPKVVTGSAARQAAGGGGAFGSDFLQNLQDASDDPLGAFIRSQGIQ